MFYLISSILISAAIISAAATLTQRFSTLGILVMMILMAAIIAGVMSTLGHLPPKEAVGKGLAATGATVGILLFAGHFPLLTFAAVFVCIASALLLPKEVGKLIGFVKTKFGAKLAAAETPKAKEPVKQKSLNDDLEDELKRQDYDGLEMDLVNGNI